MRPFTRPLLLVIFYGLLNGCNSKRTEEVKQQTDCRIQKIVMTTQSTTSNTNQETNFQYNSNGDLTQKSYVKTQTYDTGAGNQHYTVTDTYTYNTDGFLTNSKMTAVERTTLPSNVVNTVERSSTTTYVYTSNRLTSYQTRDQSGYGTTTLSATVLTYDDKGELATKTQTNTYEFGQNPPQNPSGSGGDQRIWTYKNQLLVDYVEKSGGTETRPLTLQDGLVTKMILSGRYRQQNTYDSQRRQTKTEEYFNDKQTGYFTRAWSDAKPATSTLPVFKGHPVVQPEFGAEGVMTQYDPYAINAQTNAVQHTSSSTRVPKLNAQGLIESATGEHRNLLPSAVPQRSTLTESYTYTNCQ
ncbi:hypothetical protein GCM10027347_13390 [Larkinella harenae]